MFQPKCQGGNQRNEHVDESWKEVILVEDYSKQEPIAIDHPKERRLEDLLNEDPFGSIYFKGKFHEPDSSSGGFIQLELAHKASRQLMHLHEQAKRVRKAKGQAHLARISSELAQTTSNLS
ncbi:hypothetical protein V6N12_037381 [Hibiscus sabdariffa]|uniref:Uncharacterized protein n=1 Tax=Hibiscus sabdariffa TaxID=183260 RepID=A0ABR2BZ64_9ROSI